MVLFVFFLILRHVVPVLGVHDDGSGVCVVIDYVAADGDRAFGGLLLGGELLRLCGVRFCGGRSGSGVFCLRVSARRGELQPGSQRQHCNRERKLSHRRILRQLTRRLDICLLFAAGKIYPDAPDCKSRVQVTDDDRLRLAAGVSAAFSVTVSSSEAQSLRT